MFAKKVEQGQPPEKRARLSPEEHKALKEKLAARKKILQVFGKWIFIFNNAR